MHILTQSSSINACIGLSKHNAWWFGQYAAMISYYPARAARGRQLVEFCFILELIYSSDFHEGRQYFMLMLVLNFAF